MNDTKEHSRRKFLQAVSGSGILASSTMLVGCSQGDGGGDSPANTDVGNQGTDTDGNMKTPGDAQRGGTLVASLQADPDTLHSHKSHEHAGSIFSIQTTQNLLKYNADLELVPQLATGMPAVSDDRTQLTFTLHEGVMFHKPYNSEMTAEDVVWNYRKNMDPEYGNFYQSDLTARLVDDPEEAVQATGEYEVTFTQNNSWTPEILNSLLAHPRLGILPPDAIKEHGNDFGTVSTGVWGTGPYRYVKGTQGSNYVFERHPNYFKDDLPYLDRLRFEIIREASTRSSALLTGEIDVVDVLSWQDLERIENENGVESATTFGITPGGHFTNNSGCEKLGNKTVRKALRHATNQKAIVEVQFLGNSSPNISPFPPGHEFFDENAPVRYPHNPKKTQSLLREAGAENLSLRARVTNQPFYMDGAEIVQQSLTNAGINLEIVPTDKSSTWTPALEGREEPVGCDEWETHIEDFGGQPPAHTHINTPYMTDGTLNVFHYSNENVDQWLEEAMLTNDANERQKLYNQAVEQITDDAVYNYLTYPDILQARSTSVKNYKVFPTEYLDFESVWIRE